MSPRNLLVALFVGVAYLLPGCTDAQDKKGASNERKAAPSADGVRTVKVTTNKPVFDPSKETPLPKQTKPEPKQPKEIAKATGDAWVKRGFTAGWMGMDPSGGIVFGVDPKKLRDAVPAFKGRPATNDVDLKELPAVEVPFGLTLADTRVTDAGLKELGGLKNLAMLDLNFTKVTDVGLKDLAGLKNLSGLNLRSTDVQNAGLKNLVGLENLSCLVLGNTRVTDAGLKDLAGLKKLSLLNLDLTEVSDAGLKDLGGLANLTFVNLTFTKVTDAGRNELQKALPKCRIVK